MKRPSFQFYPADWRKNTELQCCSLAARGLWAEMMCIAHECSPYGFLRINGKPMTDAQIARLVGISEGQFVKLLAELFEAGVPYRAEDGAIYIKRMVRDEEIRNARAEGGKHGALHGAKGGPHGIKGGRPRKVDAKQITPLPADEWGVIEPPLKPPPSSSSSTSVCISTDVDIKNKRASRFDAQAHLCSVGVPEQIARDWLAHRKAKRAAPTQTAIDGIAREAAKARIALSDALSICCQRGWIGFEASWINGQGLSGTPPPNGRKPTAAESRIAVIAELTGRSHGIQAAKERDITAYSERIA